MINIFFPFSHPFGDKVFFLLIHTPFEAKVFLFTPNKTVHG